MDRQQSDVLNPRVTTFVGGQAGDWSVVSQRTLSGPPIASVPKIAMLSGAIIMDPPGAVWKLRGVATNDRYTNKTEKAELVSKQAPIGRPEATCAALILMRKNPDWWALAQDQRRAILEEDSHHIAIGLRYLPAVARRLLHCRDFSTKEPFDFLGFLDYAPANAAAFDQMIDQLRATKEWTFMEREIDIRLVRAEERGPTLGEP
jgi:hypothetical protein